MPQAVRGFYPTVLWRGKKNEKCIYLTFDDGPTEENTMWILRKLDDFGIKATFFCIGKNAEEKQALFEEIKRRGHCVGSHGYSHVRGLWLHSKEYFSDIRKAASIITLTSAGPIHKAPSCQSLSSPLPLPYRDSFDYRQKGGQPLYMIDQGGAFELQEVDGRPCLMQVLDSSQKVIDWERRPTPPPYTVLGPTNLCDYRAGVSFLLDKGRSRVLLGARCALSLQKQDLPECYSIQVWDDGRWTLQLGFEVLCCGWIDGFDPAIWHRLMICCEADSISAYCDNRQLCNIQDASISSGNIVLGSDLSHVCFRDFLVEGLGEGAYCERHDALDPRIVSTPGWKKVGADAEDYNRTLLCAAGSWEVMAFSFEGTGFAITGHVGGGLGQADVYVDGRSAALIDAWSGSPRKRRCLCSVRGLPEGRHSVEIVTRGESDPDSADTDVQVNAIELIGSLVEMTKEEKQ